MTKKTDNVKLNAPVKFISKRYPNLQLLVRHGTEALYSPEGKLLRDATQPVYIKFENFSYTTDDPDLVKLIEGSSPFTGRRTNGEEDEILISRAAERSPEQAEFLNLVQTRGLLGAMEEMKKKMEQEVRDSISSDQEAAIEAARKEAADKAEAEIADAKRIAAEAEAKLKAIADKEKEEAKKANAEAK